MVWTSRACCKNGIPNCGSSDYAPSTYKGTITFQACLAFCLADANCALIEYGKGTKCSAPDDCWCWVFDNSVHDCTATTSHSRYNVWRTIPLPAPPPPLAPVLGAARFGGSAAAVLLSTLAGSGGTSGSADATGASARFNKPYDVVLTSDDTTMYVADKGGG